MLQGVDEALGVGHEPKDQAAGVADAGDVVDAAVGIVGEWAGGEGAIGPGVDQRDLIVVPEGLADGIVAGDELAFAMRDRQFEAVDAGGPDAAAGAGGEVDPAIDETAAVVV